jgi:hypothetical protein
MVGFHTLGLLSKSLDGAGAVVALGEIGESQLGPMLPGLLSDPAVPVRSAAVGALRKRSDGPAVGLLFNALSDADPGVRAAVGEALGVVRGQAGLLGGFVAAAGGSGLGSRYRATGYLVRGPEGVSSEFAGACVRTLLSVASLGWTLGAVAVFAVLGGVLVRVVRPGVAPGLAGWGVLAGVWVVGVLCWPAAGLEEKTLLVLRPVFGRVEERGRV